MDMNESQIEQRLKLGEDSAVEFKGVSKNDFKINPYDLAKSVCGFANSYGGDILVGIEDDATVTGIGTFKQADELMRQISQTCNDNLRPALSCYIQKFMVRGLPILDISVPGRTPERPYAVNGAFYIREGNRTRPANPAEVRRLVQSVDFHFDEQTVSDAGWDDLDADLLKAFFLDAYKEVPDDQRHCLFAIKCIDKDSLPTNAGILFFNREPTRWLPSARISAWRIADTEYSDDKVTDTREIKGPLLGQMDETIAFLTRNLPTAAWIDGMRRKEEPALPSLVIREAVQNAIAHRDYKSSSQTRLFIYEDRVEIINPGELLNTLTIDNIQLAGTSQIRNRTITTTFKNAFLRESAGMGIPKMIRLMKEHGLEKPTLESSAGDFRLILRYRSG